MGWDPERPAVAWSHPLPSPTRAVEKLGLRMGEAPAWCHPCPFHAKRGLEGQEGSFGAPTHLQTARTQPVFGEESSKVLLATGLASTAVSIIRYLRAHRLKGPALFLLCRQCPPPHPPPGKCPWPQMALGGTVQAMVPMATGSGGSSGFTGCDIHKCFSACPPLGQTHR